MKTGTETDPVIYRTDDYCLSYIRFSKLHLKGLQSLFWKSWNKKKGCMVCLPPHSCHTL